MKVAIVYPSLKAVGGAENVVVWLSESLAKNGHTVVLFTKDFPENVWGAIHEKPYMVHLVDFKKYRSTLKTNREAGKELGKAFFGYTFDIINPHNYPASIWVYYAKRLRPEFPKTLLYLHNLTRNYYKHKIDKHFRRLPELRTIANLWTKYRPKNLFRELRRIVLGYRRLDKRAILASDRVLINSKYAAGLAREIYGVDVHTCMLGVPTNSLLDNQAVSESKEINNGENFILTVARIELQKNISTILDAINLLKLKDTLPKGFCLKIAGAGPYLEYYMKKCQHLGLADTVRFLGFVPHQDIGKLYRDAFFIVHIPLDEPFGLVPIEAALFKKPSIVSNHGGPAEIVVDGYSGLHANALDAKDVADKIENLLKEPGRVHLMGEAAHAFVISNLTWETFINRFETHLNQTIQDNV